MSTEKPWDVAFEDHDLGLVVELKSLDDIGQAGLEIFIPEIDSGIPVMEGDFKDARFLTCLQASVIG